MKTSVKESIEELQAKCERYEKALRRIVVPKGLDTGWEYEVAKEALDEETKDKTTEAREEA